MADDRALQTSRTLPFSPEEVYGAFASPELLAAWWGPEGFSNTFEIHDFREGGRWKFIMHAPDGTEHQNESKFEVLEPNSKIVIHHDCPPNFRLTVELTAEAEGTHLTWNQVFEDAQTALVVKERAGPANEEILIDSRGCLSRREMPYNQAVSRTPKAGRFWFPPLRSGAGYRRR